MYFFNLSGLIKQLSERPSTSRESMNYLFGFLVFNGLSNLQNKMVPSSPLPVDTATVLMGLVGLLCVMAVVRFILNLMFKANGGDDGADFAGNLLAVSFVVSMRTLAFGVVPLLAAVAISASLGQPALVMVLGLPGVVVILGYILVSTFRALKHIHAGRLARAASATAAGT